MLVERRWGRAAVLTCVAWCAAAPAGDVAVPGTDPEDFLRITAVAPGYADRPGFDDRWIIYLDGYIDTGASARLERMLDAERIRTAIVYFDSPGGHVIEAMALGDLIRKRGYATGVGARASGSALPRSGRCYSACPIAYAGGVLRSLAPGSVLGTHRAANLVPVPDETAFQRAVSTQLQEYLRQMGIGLELVTMMSGVPHDAIRELTTAEAVQLGLVNAADARL